MKKVVLITHDDQINRFNVSPGPIRGTVLQDTITISYQQLVETFGEPNRVDDNKVDAQWLIYTTHGMAIIYNWKNGKNYLGDEGLPIEKIIKWNIGGHTVKSAERIRKALGLQEDTSCGIGNGHKATSALSR